ncbi:hypothetical protein ACSSS7_007493 [Eimeria intestinalis]
MAFVFLISYCRERIMSSGGPSVVQRRLATVGKGGEEDANEQSYQRICATSEERLDQEEGTTSSGSHQQPAQAGSFAKGKPRKRKGDHEQGKKQHDAPKTVKLLQGEAVQAGTFGSAPTLEFTSSFAFSADDEGSGQNIQKQDSSLQFDLRQGTSEGSTTPSDKEERITDGVSSANPDELAKFTLEEALMAEKSLSLDSSSLDLNDSPLQASPLLSEDLIPGLVKQLDPYITEALEAKEDALLELWLLDPEAPMPSSPVASSGVEVLEERPKGPEEVDGSPKVLAKSAKPLPHGQKTPADSSGAGESSAASYDLHEAEATSESTQQASVSPPSFSPPIPLSNVAESISSSQGAGALHEEQEGAVVTRLHALSYVW